VAVVFELPPGLRFYVIYHIIDLPASKQVISLDSLPLGETYIADFASPIQWGEFSLMHWDDDSLIEWDAATAAPQTIDLKR
jgi:hypothetical protein